MDKIYEILIIFHQMMIQSATNLHELALDIMAILGLSVLSFPDINVIEL